MSTCYPITSETSAQPQLLIFFPLYVEYSSSHLSSLVFSSCVFVFVFNNTFCSCSSDCVSHLIYLDKWRHNPYRGASDCGTLIRSFCYFMVDSIWISSVTNSTLNISRSTYSFQDALSLFGLNAYGSFGSDLYSGPPYLFQNGCLQPDGTKNCTASCQDKSVAFSSLDTLHNCMVYPTVAALYAGDNPDRLGNLSNPGLAEDYNIQKAELNSTLSINITTTIKTCLVDYCNATPGCTAGLKQYDANNNMSSPSNIDSNFYIYNQITYQFGIPEFDICEFVPRSLNPDIGGIGV